MDYKTKQKDNASVQITVKTTAEEVEEAYQAAYLKARKHLKLPGFRKGKVPTALAEKHLGESVAGDAARLLIADAVESFVEELEPPPITIPSFEVESFDRKKGAVYVGTYDTTPEVKLGKYRKRKAVLDTVVVEKSSIDERLEQMREQHATVKTREEDEVSAAEDMFQLDLRVLDGDEEVYRNEELRVYPSRNEFIPGLAERLVGIKLGHEGPGFDVDFPEAFPVGELSGRKLKVTFKVAQIQFAEFPELNDEFAAGIGEHETLDALKSSIEDEMKTQGEGIVNRKARGELLQAVVADSKFVIPESLVEKEMERRVKALGSRIGMQDLTVAKLAETMGQDAEKITADLRETAVKSIQEDLTLLEISKKEEIQVSDEQVAKGIQERFGSMMPPAELSKWAEDPKMQENMRSSLTYEAAMEWIFDNSDVKPGAERTYAELSKEEQPGQ